MSEVLTIKKKTAGIVAGFFALYGVYQFWKLLRFVKKEGSLCNAFTRTVINFGSILKHIPVDSEKNIQQLRDLGAKARPKPTNKFIDFDFPARDKKGTVELRVVFPRASSSSSSTDLEEKKSSLYPIIIWYHGGGMVLGDHRDVGIPEALANKCNAVVVSVGYRLAPRSKFPGPVEDSYDALLWSHQNADKFNGDPSNISVIGESAGGNLAANVSILARDNSGPHVTRLVMVVPWLDGTLSFPSVARYDQVIDQTTLLWLRNNYIRSYRDTTDPRFSVILQSNLSYLPKTLTIAAELDPLVDEALAFHQSLIQAGNSLARYTVYKNVPHGFYGLLNWYWKVDGSGRRAHSEICDFLTS